MILIDIGLDWPVPFVYRYCVRSPPAPRTAAHRFTDYKNPHLSSQSVSTYVRGTQTRTQTEHPADLH